MKSEAKFFDKFENVKILVIGDVMLDRYFWGSVTRISPEAPVPVVKLEKVTAAVGGAANVAANAAGLGAEVHMLGVVGKDEENSAQLIGKLREKNVLTGGLICSAHRPTTTKTRIIAHQQQIVRLDEENTEDLSAADETALLRAFDNLIEKVDVVVISDYAKGTLTTKILKNCIAAARNSAKPILVDPKGFDYGKYNGASLLTPNRSEAQGASGQNIGSEETLENAGRKLLDELQIDALLITLGEDGMRLFARGKKDSVQIDSMARQVYDVTGAGDTVVATLAVALGAGANLETAARLANTAAGLVVQEVGTTTITLSALQNALDQNA